MNRNSAIRKAKAILHKREQAKKRPTMAIWYYGKPEPAKVDLLVKIGFRTEEKIKENIDISMD